MKKAYINGIILDGTKEMAAQTEKVLLVDDNQIVGIVSHADIPNDYQTIDLAGQYVMPGLINLHVHLPSTGKPSTKQSDPVKLVKIITNNALFRKIGVKICEQAALIQLKSGVTTIRTVGGVADFDTIIRDKIASGKVVGPRILASNMAVSVPQGHMAGSLGYEAHSPEEAAHFVEKIAKDHPDLIKLMITGGVLDAKAKGEPGELKMPVAYVKAACDKAHELGLKVAAHVESPSGVQVALANGVDTIEHGAKPTEEIIQLFKQRQAALVATLSPALPYALFDQSVSHVSDIEKYNGKVVFDGIVNCAKTCLENGIVVGLGTDTGCPYITHYDMWRELNYFHQYCGVSTAFALHTATAINAKIADIDQKVGTLEAGKLADFIVTKDNPLENLEALRHVTMVVTNGKQVKNLRIKKYEAVEKELDKFK